MSGPLLFLPFFFSFLLSLLRRLRLLPPDRLSSAGGFCRSRTGPGFLTFPKAAPVSHAAGNGQSLLRQEPLPSPGDLPFDHFSDKGRFLRPAGIGSAPHQGQKWAEPLPPQGRPSGEAVPQVGPLRRIGAFPSFGRRHPADIFFRVPVWWRDVPTSPSDGVSCGAGSRQVKISPCASVTGCCRNGLFP